MSAINRPATITPTWHEKAEWSRMAQAAYRANFNQIGHRYSIAASLASGERMTTARFDALQAGYREWLVFNRFPATAA